MELTSASYPTSIQLRRRCLGMTALQLQCFAEAVDEYAHVLIQELRVMADKQGQIPMIRRERDQMLSAFAQRWHRRLKEHKELIPLQRDRSLGQVEKIALADLRTLLESPPHGFHWEECNGLQALGIGNPPWPTTFVIIS